MSNVKWIQIHIMYLYIYVERKANVIKYIFFLKRTGEQLV